MSLNEIRIIDFVFDKETLTFSLSLNLWMLLVLVAIYFLTRYFIWLYKKNSNVERNIEPVTIKYSVGGVELEYEIVRNYQNIEVAHRIYIELITRKAAIEIEEDKDVIVEIYNSWYSLFQITREELKSINGKLLKDNNTSSQLVNLLTDILNKGLRPHLTEYQAKFRKWYSKQAKENGVDSPQDIQSQYDDFEALMSSMKEVNRTLIEYSKQLKRIVDGE